MLKVLNYLLLIVDSGNCAVLILLDLSAASDTLDHGIILNRLQQIGIQDCVLSWFVSYLKDQTFLVETGKYSSSCAPVLYGVPQGSILGPVLFSLYMLPLYVIFKKDNVSYHCYADDTQCNIPPEPKGCLQCLFDCLRDVKHWMSANFLQLNESKGLSTLIAMRKSEANHPRRLLSHRARNECSPSANSRLHVRWRRQTMLSSSCSICILVWFTSSAA